MTDRRSRNDIVLDILKALERNAEGIKFTHLLYKSNLSHARLHEYVDKLIEKEFIVCREPGTVPIGRHSLNSTNLYFLTDRGAALVNEMKAAHKILEESGLSNI